MSSALTDMPVGLADTLNMILSESRHDHLAQDDAGRVNIAQLSSALGKVSSWGCTQGPAAAKLTPAALQPAFQIGEGNALHVVAIPEPTALACGCGQTFLISKDVLVLLWAQAVQQQVHLEQLKKQVRQDNQRRRDLSRYRCHRLDTEIR